MFVNSIIITKQISFYRGWFTFSIKINYVLLSFGHISHRTRHLEPGFVVDVLIAIYCNTSLAKEPSIVLQNVENRPTNTISTTTISM
jgi:hypothetical protein